MSTRQKREALPATTEPTIIESTQNMIASLAHWLWSPIEFISDMLNFPSAEAALAQKTFHHELEQGAMLMREIAEMYNASTLQPLSQ